MYEDRLPDKKLSLHFDPLMTKFGFKYHQLKGKYAKPMKPGVPGSDEQFSINKFKCDMCHDNFDNDEAVPVEHGRKVVCMDCAKKFYDVSPMVNAESFKQWLEACEECKKPRPSKKVTNYKEKIPKGTRDIRKDVSDDYFGNIEKLGDGLGPFKVLKSRGKSAAPVAH